MLFRLVIAFAVIVVVAAVSAWLADHPGEVTLQWGDVLVETSVAVVAALLAVLVVAVALLDRFWRWVRRSPVLLGASLAENRRRRGYQALTRGLAAVAAGDAREAERLSRKAESLLDEPSLTLLLSAQAAQLAGRREEALRSFTAMLESPDTEFLGLRGLLVQAVRAGDRETALRHARRAFELRPDTPWVVKTLFDLQAAAGDWAGARQTLDQGVRKGLVERELGNRRRALLLVAEANDEEARGNGAAALELALQAHRLEPAFVPAAAVAARQLVAQGKRRKAAKIVLKTWSANPHPDLARIFAAIEPGEDPVRRWRRMAALRAGNPDHKETRMALAAAALEAGEWEEVRGELEPLIAAGEADVRAYELMSEVERRQHGDSASAREWLVKAASARPADGWVCQSCGRTAETWAPHCGFCGAFDSLRWGGPAGGAAPRLDAAVAALEADLDPVPALPASAGETGAA